MQNASNRHQLGKKVCKIKCELATLNQRVQGSNLCAHQIPRLFHYLTTSIGRLIGGCRFRVNAMSTKHRFLLIAAGRSSASPSEWGDYYVVGVRNWLKIKNPKAPAYSADRGSGSF